MNKKLLILFLSTSSYAVSANHILEDSFIMIPTKTKVDEGRPFSQPYSTLTSHVSIPSKLTPTSNHNCRHLPVISQSAEDDSHLNINTSFMRGVETYAQMIDLSYHLVKGRNALSTSLMEDLLSKGWRINAFGGFSGRLTGNTGNYEAANHDLTGFVAFNKLTGEAVVTFHGSQDGFDWQNNLDGQKVSASENGLKFDGSVHKGINYRYQSSKHSIYAILDRFYNDLDNKDLFHITTTGHSLGGGMAALGYADLSTDYMKAKLGTNYHNPTHSRVRSLAVSPPRVFDGVATDDLNHSVGAKNIIIDAVHGDPVTMSGPGKSVTQWLEGSSPYGMTAGLLNVAKRLHLIPYSNPQAVAFTHGDYQHLGTKALQESAKVKAIADALNLREANISKAKPEGFFKRLKNYVAKGVAHFHYGRITPWGVAFEKEFLEGHTLEQRVNLHKRVSKEVQLNFKETSK